MDNMNEGLLFLVLVLILAVTGLFEGLETGVVSLNRVRLRARARRGDDKAKELLRLLERPERLLTAFLIGNTLAVTGAGALASAWAVQAMENETLGSITATVGMTAGK